jgi:uncharacterized protein YfaS (alpha-2-macroglobulin family)
MRLRIPAIAAAAVLIYLAIEHRSELPALPDPTAMIINMRNQVPTFRFKLTTDPEPAVCDTPITLRVQAVDIDGHPADGLSVEAEVFLTDLKSGSHHVTFRRKNNGMYEGRLEVETTGSWNVDLAATKDGQRGTQRLSLEVGARVEPSSRDRDDDDT